MILPKRCWYPAFVIYRWRHVLWLVPLLALLCLLGFYWNRLRWDHAMTVLQTRPTVAVLAGRTAPAWLSEQSEVIRSPEVLGKAAVESGLAMEWQMTEAQAAERLRGYVVCEAIPGTAVLELKVRKLPEGNPTEICKAITKHASKRLDADRDAEIAQAAAERRAVVLKAVVELEAKIEKAREEFVKATPVRVDDVDSRARFESLMKIHADRRMLEQLKQQMMSAELGCHCGALGALGELEAPHWPGKPSQRHLLDFGVAAAWTSGISMLVALALAYLLEALIPRKGETGEIIPEGEAAHGCP